MSSLQRRAVHSTAVVLALGLGCAKERDFAEPSTPSFVGQVPPAGGNAAGGANGSTDAASLDGNAAQLPGAGGGECEPNEGSCMPALDGAPSGAQLPPSVGPCQPGPRDCTSALDNDCDGSRDDTLDSVCTCAPGMTVPCDEHPGLDGTGICRAGQRTCVLSPGNTSASFGACEGAVGPSSAEVCDNDLDDDCDGVSNEADACGGCTDTCFCEEAACVEMVAVESSSSTVCALSTTGNVWCWGANQSGQAGVSGFLDQLRPAPVDGLAGVTMLAVGNATNCALLRDTSVVCWGTNFSGELGDNGVVDVSFLPVQVVEASGAPLTGISKVVAGSQYACALRAADGAVFCWGRFVGNGTNVGSPAASQVLRFGDVPLVQIGDIEGGTDVVMARSGASWLSWGSGAGLGQGEARSALVATQLMSQPLPSFLSVAVGTNNACGTTAAGEAYCWGNDVVLAGLGAGEIEIPTRFPVLDGSQSFGIGSRIAFAVDAAGGMRAFGDSSDGLTGGLNDPDATEPLSPTAFPGVSFVRQVAVGVNFACVLQDDDSIACWGINNRGQIGIGSTTRSDAPVLVQPLPR